MGNLNKFYLLGRVAKAPAATGAGDSRVCKVWLSPGTAGGNRRRGAGLPLVLHAYGPQVDVALELTVGQGVLARGQLRQEPQGGGDALVAQIQAIELLSGRPRRPRPEGQREGAAGEAGEAGEAAEGGEGGEAAEGAGEDGRGTRRRRRRRRGRKPEGGDGSRPAAGGEGEGKPAPPPKPAAPVVPPEPPPVAPPPDPSYQSDIPF